MSRALCVDLSPDGKTLAIGTYDLVLWDVAVKKPIDTLAHPEGGVNEAVFSPDGKSKSCRGHVRFLRPGILRAQTGGSQAQCQNQYEQNFLFHLTSLSKEVF
jgi:WD40 repeat protein